MHWKQNREWAILDWASSLATHQQGMRLRVEQAKLVGSTHQQAQDLGLREGPEGELGDYQSLGSHWQV